MMRRIAPVISAMVLALALSACAGIDFNQRGWQIKAFASLPPQGPLVNQEYYEPRPTRIVRSTDHYEHERTYTRTVRCHPPHWLMEEESYYHDDYVRRYRELQRYVRRECR